MKNLLVATITALTLVSCNKPGVVWNDWAPSLFFAIAGLVGLIWGVTRYLKGKKLESSGFTKDEGVSLQKSGGIIAFVALLVLIFGVSTYFS